LAHSERTCCAGGRPSILWGFDGEFPKFRVIFFGAVMAYPERLLKVSELSDVTGPYRRSVPPYQVVLADREPLNAIVGIVGS